MMDRMRGVSWKKVSFGAGFIFVLTTPDFQLMTDAKFCGVCFVMGMLLYALGQTDNGKVAAAIRATALGPTTVTGASFDTDLHPVPPMPPEAK